QEHQLIVELEDLVGRDGRALDLAIPYQQGAPTQVLDLDAAGSAGEPQLDPGDERRRQWRSRLQVAALVRAPGGGDRRALSHQGEARLGIVVARLAAAEDERP